MLRSLLALASAGALAACGPTTSIDTTDADLEQAATTVVYHSTWKSGQASASYGDNLSGGYIDVWQTSATTASASINSWEMDPASEVCEDYTYSECVQWNEETWECLEFQDFTYTYCYFTRYSFTYGYGDLAGASITSNPSRFRVRADLADATYFWGYSCEIDYAANIFDCTDGAVGTIDVSWVKDGLYSSFQNGISQYNWGKFSSKTTGQYRSSSATASGSALGVNFQGASGWMSSNKGAGISKDVIAN